MFDASLLFALKKAFRFLFVKHPGYLVFGVFFVVERYFSRSLFVTSGVSPEQSVTLAPWITTLAETLSSPLTATLILLSALIVFWALKLVLTALLILRTNSLSKKTPTPFRNDALHALKSLPKIAWLHIVFFVFVLSLGIFLFLPVLALMGGPSTLGALVLGALALFIFCGALFIFGSVYLFAHMYLLLSKSTFRESLDLSYNLYQKKKSEAISFLLFFFCFFLGVYLLFSITPQFTIASQGIVSTHPSLPFSATLLGTLVIFVVESAFLSFFPIVATLFFLSLAKQKPQKASPQTENLPSAENILLKKDAQSAKE